MTVRNEENRVGWAACALARHVDALVVREDASDDGTGMALLITCEPSTPNHCLTAPAQLKSFCKRSSAAVLSSTLSMLPGPGIITKYA